MISLILLVFGCVALAYQVVALAATIVHAERARLSYHRPLAAYTPGVSVLKPVRGLDLGFYEAICSQAAQEYPEFEILFGVAEGDDPAVAVIERLMAEQPARQLRLIRVKRTAMNAKVATLVELERAARYPVIVVNDADISVGPDYLRRVVAPLADDKVGVVTCLYRATADSLAGHWEALGIATDFIPSTLVAPLVGVKEFGLGSTLAFRAADWQALGGFKTLEAYIADDYHLAKRLTAGGRHAHMSEVVVATTLGAPAWRDAWRHQVRWARTIRVSRALGYAFLPVTQAGVWAVLNLAAGNWGMAVALTLARITMGLAGGFGVLRHWPALMAAPLIPLWDWFAFAVYVAGMSGRTVWWRGRKMRLDAEGRLTDV